MMKNRAPYFWQQQQWQTLTELATKKRMPHALLLRGITGLGKYDFALNFAKFLLCESQSDSFACNHCKACNLFGKQCHPDFHSISPEEEGKTLKVDQVKNLVSTIVGTSQYNGYKVCLLYPAEAMNASAANALLKTLEEPVSDKTIFLLISNQYMQLPATIRSRCQQINFQPPNDKTVQSWLLDNDISFDKEALKTSLVLAQNAPLRVREILTSETNLQQQLFDDLLSFINSDAITVPAFVKTYSKLQLKDFVLNLQLALTQFIKSTLTEKELKPGLLEGCFTILDSLNYHKAITAKNIALNAQLLMENYLIKVENLRRKE